MTAVGMTTLPHEHSTWRSGRNATDSPPPMVSTAGPARDKVRCGAVTTIDRTEDPSPTIADRLRRAAVDTRPLTVPAFRRVLVGQGAALVWTMLRHRRSGATATAGDAGDADAGSAPGAGSTDAGAAPGAAPGSADAGVPAGTGAAAELTKSAA